MTENLVVQYYREEDNPQVFIRAIRELIEANITNPAAAVVRNLSVNTAEGVWLDFIGERVGLPRPFVAREDINTFGFDDNGIGFDQGPFLASGTETTVPIADVTYRRYIKAKGGQLITDGTVPVMDATLMAAFGQGHYIDNMDMTMQVRVSLGLTSDLLNVVRQSGLITKPAGVRLTVLYDESPETGSFGFDDNGKGFDQAPFITVYDLET